MEPNGPPGRSPGQGALDYDPEHPDVAHEVDEDCTDDPADLKPGRGTADEAARGELPAEIADAPGGA